MLEFLVDTLYMKYGDRTFRQEIGIPMDTSCASLLADLFLYIMNWIFCTDWQDESKYIWPRSLIYASSISMI